MCKLGGIGEALCGGGCDVDAGRSNLGFHHP